MKSCAEKLLYKKCENKICVEIDGYKIYYSIQEKENYVAYSGAATVREQLENIENEEASTHYLHLEDSEWKTIIHGFVPFEFYKVTDNEEADSRLVARFMFTGAGTSQKRARCGEVEVLLGKLSVNDNELKLITDDGKEHFYTK